MTALRVTAVLDSTAVIPGGIFGLDAPLSWGWIQRRKERREPAPPLTATFAPDLPLPLARHDLADTWIWRTSRAHWEIAQQITINVRRKPATAAMARYGKDRKHHAGLGPYKARDAILPGVAAREVWWDADVTDPDELADLLRHITHLGPRHRNGFGHVAEWRVDPGDADGWADRPMPTKTSPITEGIRSPYWHPSRAYPVTAC